MEDENEAGAAGKIGPPPIVVHSDPGHQSTGHQDEGSSVPRGGTRAVAEALLTRMKSQRQPEVKKMSDVAQSRGKEEGHGSKLAEEATVPIPIDNVNNLALQHPSRIDILRPVDPGQPHYIDVVAVHDYDETSVNWAYVDNKVIVRQKLEMIRAERSKIPENSEQATAADVHDERGRQPLMVASGMPASSLAPNLAPPGRSVSRAPSLREAAKGGDAARRDDKIAVPGLSVEARDVPHVTNRNFEVGSSRASSQSRREVGSNWLQDANMLPEALLGARVLGFSYYSRDLTQLLKDNSEQSKKPDFIEKTSRELLRELCEFRQSDSFDNVPIIFIGAGFGGLVVQKAISLVVSNTDSGGEDPYSKTLGRLELGALEDQVVPEPPHLNLDHIADVIFMDTPFPSPKKEGEGLQNFFPLSASSVRISGIQKVVKKMETEWDSPGVDKIWGEFWALLYQRNQKVRIAWLYSSTASITTGSVRMNIPLNLKKTSQISAERKSPAIVLNRIPLHRSGLRRLTSFSDAKDYGYTVTISRIRESLMIRAVQDDKLEDLQLSLMKAGVSVDVNDEWGMSLLHLAATAPNPDGLKILLDNNADPQTKDSKGQTPLHSSIRMYCDSEVDAGIMMENLKRVIEKLLDFTTKPELNLNTDNQKWTIRDILQPHRHRCSGPGCTHETIRDLIARHRPFVRKRKTDDKDEAWKNWEPPADGSIQQRACEGTKAIIAEFYSTKEDKASSDYDRPSVLDLIYHRESGPADILTKKAETNISRLKGEEDVYCRWIHVPANNEQWIHDLFLRLRLRDNSMNGQRHKGYKVFSEYMTADAKQYKHSSLSKTSKGQQPTLHSIPELQADGVEWHQLPSPKGITGVSDAIAIFMPVLAFEEHRPRKKMTKAIHRRLQELKTPETGLPRRDSAISQAEKGPKRDRNTELNAPVVDTSVIEAYLGHERPVHCRRTLDQYRYYMLESTESRDRDQVVYKWARTQQKKESKGGDRTDGAPGAGGRPIIMVDQLWLWILPDGTVISSLPNTAYANEAYNLGCKLELALFGGSDAPVQSVDDLVAVILRNCVDFFRRDGPCEVKFQDSFQYSINDIAEAEVKTYEIYKNAVTRLQELKDNRRLRTLGQKYTETFSQITEETNRLVEVMDIQDELSIVESVLKTQKSVLQKLVQKINTSKKAKNPKPDAPVHGKEPALQDALRIQDVIQIVDDNINNVREMGASARKVQDDLKQLLDFKQQQSNAWEMQYSMKLAVQGRKQNNIMLVFTLVTIVFLPMSFLSSFFAIGIQEFPTDPNTGNVSWPIGDLSAYLFGISLALCVPLLLAAFFVNDISRMARGKIRRDQLDQDSLLIGKGSRDHDSDESGSEGGADRKTPNWKQKRKNANTSDAEVHEYALLFGYFNFHTKVPFVRRLWEFWPYPVEEELEDLDENLELDYPLSRFRKRIVEPANKLLLRIGLRKLGTAYLNHERAYILDRTSNGLVKQLRKEQMELREQERRGQGKQRAKMEADRMSEKNQSLGPGARKWGALVPPRSESSERVLESEVVGLGPRLRQGLGIRGAFGGRRHERQATGEQV